MIELIVINDLFLLSRIPYNLKFSRIKYFMVLPNQKQILTDKFFVVKVPVMNYICCKFEILQEKIFTAIL